MKGRKYSGPLGTVEKIIASYQYNCVKEKLRRIDYNYYKEYEPNNIELIKRLSDQIHILEK